MKITHPVKGYDGHVRVGDAGFDFLAGVAHRKADEIPAPVRKAMEDAEFAFEDDRPGRSKK